MAQTKPPPFTLYEYRPSPFCVAVRLALEECEVLFTAREVDLNKPRTAAFLKRSPFGRLPALVEHRPGGELAIFESTAILLFLADRFPESSLAFDDLGSKAEATSWLSFIANSFSEVLWATVLEESVYEDDQKSGSGLQRSRAELERQLDVFDKHLARRAFLAGDYSVADTLATPLLDMLDRVDNLDMDAYPRVRDWRKRLRTRASYKNAWPQEKKS
tara:strand:- start:915 stop:1565 length:651 start_codon:yes stop_codon:yes gene_type:complete